MKNPVQNMRYSRLKTREYHVALRWQYCSALVRRTAICCRAQSSFGPAPRSKLPRRRVGTGLKGANGRAPATSASAIVRAKRPVINSLLKNCV